MIIRGMITDTDSFLYGQNVNKHLLFNKASVKIFAIEKEPKMTDGITNGRTDWLENIVNYGGSFGKPQTKSSPSGPTTNALPPPPLA